MWVFPLRRYQTCMQTKINPLLSISKLNFISIVWETSLYVSKSNNIWGPFRTEKTHSCYKAGLRLTASLALQYEVSS